MAEKKFGFIGCGNMGGAILTGAMEKGVLQGANTIIYDALPAVMEKFADHGVAMAKNSVDLCDKADIILLAVKPQYLPALLQEIGPALKDKCVISIAAGKRTEYLKSAIKNPCRVLRVMPNTPVMVYEGAMVLCSDNDLTMEEWELTDNLFGALGIVEWVPEDLFDAVVGLSGSGPAYAAMFIEALADGGVREGLPRKTAYRLAAQTVLGTAKLILGKEVHPGALKDMVSSPGGTTIEGCLALEVGGMRAAVMQSVSASAQKSRKL